MVSIIAAIAKATTTNVTIRRILRYLLPTRAVLPQAPPVT